MAYFELPLSTPSGRSALQQNNVRFVLFANRRVCPANVRFSQCRPQSARSCYRAPFNLETAAERAVECDQSAGRAAQSVAGLTSWVKHVGGTNINTCTPLLAPCSGQLPFLGLIHQAVPGEISANSWSGIRVDSTRISCLNFTAFAERGIESSALYATQFKSHNAICARAAERR